MTNLEMAPAMMNQTPGTTGQLTMMRLKWVEIRNFLQNTLWRLTRDGVELPAECSLQAHDPGALRVAQANAAELGDLCVKALNAYWRARRWMLDQGQRPTAALQEADLKACRLARLESGGWPCGQLYGVKILGDEPDDEVPMGLLASAGSRGFPGFAGAPAFSALAKPELTVSCNVIWMMSSYAAVSA